MLSKILLLGFGLFIVLFIILILILVFVNIYKKSNKQIYNKKVNDSLVNHLSILLDEKNKKDRDTEIIRLGKILTGKCGKNID